ncbi:TnsA-like heteromeric transposase endonuclease subunit [Streptomyces sp. NPDC005078]|uniref:TnsA-like heteromeric transposase endonuclease subunit n=1 Tax=unclassified Streptomyces TaxID=2593676 RepID=UPI0033AC7F24
MLVQGTYRLRGHVSDVWGCYLNEFGELAWARPEGLAGIPLEERQPPSTPVAYHDRQGKITDWSSATTGVHVVCGSLRRKAVAIELDFDPDIVWFSGEPVELQWTSGRRKNRWRPDFMARTADGERVATVLRPEHSGPQWHERLAVLDEVAEQAQWQVNVVDVPHGVRAANLEWAADYRQMVPIDAWEVEAVLTAFQRPQRVREGALASGVPELAALDLVYRLIWQRRLQIHWDQPLLPTALAWVAPETA